MPEEPRQPARHGYLVVLFYVVAALALTWPLARNFGSHLPAVFVSYDALLHVFLLGWGWHGLTTDPLGVFDAPIFYPEPRTLTYMDHLLGQAVLGGPVIELFGLGAAYNSLILFSFVASGYFVYRPALRYMGARRLIVHYGDYPPALREELRRRVRSMGELRKVAVFDQDVVYEIELQATP